VNSGCYQTEETVGVGVAQGWRVLICIWEVTISNTGRTTELELALYHTAAGWVVATFHDRRPTLLVAFQPVRVE